MAFTLFDVAYRVALELGIITNENTATGGSTTTIADSVHLTQADDYWNEGTAFVLYDAGGAGAAPQGEFSEISDFANTGGVVTLRSTLTAAVASGDRYALAKKRYKLETITRAVNQALFEVGDIPVTDTTNITFASSQTEYTLPIGASDVREVWIATNTDTNDYGWSRYDNWYVQKTVTGTADTLVFKTQPPTGYACKFVYMGKHPEVYTAAAKIDEWFNMNRLRLLVYSAVANCLDYMMTRQGVSQELALQIQDYKSRAAGLKIIDPADKPRKKMRPMMNAYKLDRRFNYPGDRDV